MPALPEASRNDVASSDGDSDEPFRLLVESVKDYAIFRLDPGGFVATWNVGAERIKGYRADEIIGQHFSRFYPEQDVRAGKCEMELEVAAREGRFEDEGFRVRKDGSLFWANVVITALRDRSGTLVGFAKVTRDLTERKAAEEERLRLGRLASARLQAFANMSEALAQALSIEDVGRIVTERRTSFTQADTCMLYQLREQSNVLELVAEDGCNPEIVPRIRHITADSGNPSYAIGTGAAPAAWIESAEQYEAFFPALARVPAQGPRAQAFYCVPLVAEGRAIGLLGVGYHEPRTFPIEEREFVETFARQCAQALARARRVETERAAAALAERLRASLATTLRSIGDAVIAADATGAITLMNGVAESLTGFREAAALGKPLGEVFHVIDERTRAPVPTPFERVLATSGAVELFDHTLLVGSDGTEVPIDESGAPIRADDGTVEGVVLVFRDISERKREESRRELLADATTALGQSLDYERTVAYVARLAVPRLSDFCIIDVALDVDRAPKRLAVAHADPAKLPLARAFGLHQHSPAGDIARVLVTGRAELCADTSEAPRALEVTDPANAAALHLRSYMVVPLLSRGRPFGAITFAYGESGRNYSKDDLAFAEELARRCAVAVENARLYASEQHARRNADVANRSKDEFLAVVSHELRTPLNAIMGWAKMLTRPDFDQRRRASAVETIERNSVAMAQLIEDLLDMSRVISGKMRLDVQPVALAQVVEAALDSIRPAANAKSVKLTSVLDTAIPQIMGDPTRLQQIVWNLVSNAVKFSERDGRVEVLLRRVGSSLEVSVRDFGKGIAPAFLPHVFDAFRQEDASPSRARGGLGLGLAITRQLVELHGGRIEARSEGEGCGATFSVSLPISAVAPISPEERPPHRPHAEQLFERPAHLHGLKVLVVDDEEDSRDLVRAILDDCGCRVTTSRSVAEAMVRLGQDLPDVLISDIGMPQEDGYDLIRKVRALPREKGGDIPAAALTAYARAEDRRRLLSAGYSIHLPKPVEPAELVAVVATLSRFIHRSDAASS